MFDCEKIQQLRNMLYSVQMKLDVKETAENIKPK